MIKKNNNKLPYNCSGHIGISRKSTTGRAEYRSGTPGNEAAAVSIDNNTYVNASAVMVTSIFK